MIISSLWTPAAGTERVKIFYVKNAFTLLFCYIQDWVQMPFYSLVGASAMLGEFKSMYCCY